MSGEYSAMRPKNDPAPPYPLIAIRSTLENAPGITRHAYRVTRNASGEEGNFVFNAFRVTRSALRKRAPGRIRTCNLLVRSQTIYPVDLRALNGK